MITLAAQLYTVRDHLTDAPAIRNTMEKIREIGYTAVQLFGAAEPAEKCARAAAEAGLRISGILANLDKYEENLDAYLEICGKYGIKDLGVSASVTEPEAVAEYIKRANRMARTVKAYGLTFSYHNHATEFIKLPDGRRVMDCYLEGFEKGLIDFMPDTYWVHCGGFDVRRFLELTEGRVKILHLKDMKYTKDGQTFAEVGSGNLYFEGILPLARKLGIDTFVVEQDSCDGDPIQSLKKSYEYVRSLL